MFKLSPSKQVNVLDGLQFLAACKVGIDEELKEVPQVNSDHYDTE